MWPKVLRKRIPTLIGLTLMSAVLPHAAWAQDGFYAGAGFGFYRPSVAVGLGFGFSHPFDDSYDPPSGYGEYATYGPWAYRRYGGCALTERRVRTGPRWRTVRLCN